MDNTNNNNKQLNHSHTLSTTDSPNNSVSNSPYSSYNMNSNNKDQSIDEEKSFEIVQDGMKQSTVNFAEPHLVKRGLTEVSAMFDRNGKGYLDDTERALRRMDSQNEGFLGVDKVCVIFESLQAEQERSSDLLEALRDESKKSMNLKMGVIALTCFTLLLALANIGTSFAIAQLVKDMEVTDGELQGTSTGMRVGTTAKIIDFEMNSLDDTRRRRLQADSSLACAQMTSTDANGDTRKTCSLQGVMQKSSAERLHSELAQVNFVQLSCNGRRSEIAGGTHLMGTPSVVNMGIDYLVLPDGSNANEKYQAIQSVKVPGVTGNQAEGRLAIPSSFCDANFELGMFCPTELVNGKEPECMVMTAFLPTIECATSPVICGPKPRSPYFIN